MFRLPGPILVTIWFVRAPLIEINAWTQLSFYALICIITDLFGFFPHSLFFCTSSCFLALFQLLHCQCQYFRWGFRSEYCMLSVRHVCSLISFFHSLSFCFIAVLMPFWCVCISLWCLLWCFPGKFVPQDIEQMLEVCSNKCLSFLLYCMFKFHTCINLCFFYFCF